jgi:hypothetical protein
MSDINWITRPPIPAGQAKPGTSSIVTRMTNAMHERIVTASIAADVSMNTFVVTACERLLGELAAGEQAIEKLAEGK